MPEQSQPLAPAAAGAVPTADGGSLEWEAHGDADDERAPLLLVAGQAVTRRSWDALVPALAAGPRTILVDHRGIGGSLEGERPPRTTAGFADDLATLLDGRGIARAHVVGHSMGGRVGQRLGIGHPDRVASLVLVATTGGDARGAKRSPQATRDLASGDPARLGPRFFTEAYLAAHPEAIGLFVRPEGTISTRRRHFEASSTHDAWDELLSIAEPTLVVHGAADSITLAENGRRIAELVPDAAYLELPGLRHAPQLEDAGFAARVLARAEAAEGR